VDSLEPENDGPVGAGSILEKPRNLLRRKLTKIENSAVIPVDAHRILS
jgi:hypothetical protein